MSGGRQALSCSVVSSSKMHDDINHVVFAKLDKKDLLTAARNMSVFDKVDKFGTILLLKLAMITATLLSAVSQTACMPCCQPDWKL